MKMIDISRFNTDIIDCLNNIPDTVTAIETIKVSGKLSRMIGLTLEAEGCVAAIGEKCKIKSMQGYIYAEVVGFSEGKTYLMPAGEVRGLLPGARIIPTGQTYQAFVGEQLLGRVIDSNGKPLDGKGQIRYSESRPLSSLPINPLERSLVHSPLNVGVRSINSLLTVGRGQRMGLFAGSGVGKSVLMGMMTKNTSADITVVALIGERGREVKDFIENILGDEAMKKAIVIAAPADTSPMKRLHGAFLATSIAEYFRDKGLNVLLLMDSLTRFAQAQREVALAIGEPPATKGYPPSVFSLIPGLVERAGNSSVSGGSITGFYTVLTEGDDPNDPIADSARAILDGHIVLNREIAEKGIYPAIDIEMSISRVMNDIVSNEHIQLVRLFRDIYSRYKSNQDLINLGAYKSGSNKDIDLAINSFPKLIKFLKQDIDEASDYQDSLNSLASLINAIKESGNTHEAERA